MRTTLDIDEDVLLAAKDIGRMQGLSAGRIISDWARKGFLQPKKKLKYRNGMPLVEPLPGDPIVTTEMVNRWLDENP